MITRPAYCTRDDVASASDIALSPRSVREIDRALCAGASAIDEWTNRRFYPTVATLSFRWPTRPMGGPAWRLWLDEREIVSVTSLTSGGVAVDTADIFLEPQPFGAPYSRLELDQSTAAAFSGGASPQRSVVVAGVWDWPRDTAVVGTLVGGINASVTTAVTSNSTTAGPGDLLICGTEYMLVTDSAMVTTSQTLQADIAADSAVTSVSVTTGSAYASGEVIQLDSEQMEITSVTSNTLTVTRAVRGTVLAAHSGATVYAPRSLTVVRGYAGTTAASHSNGDPLARHLPPPLVSQLNLALAQTGYAEGSGAYARPAGAGDNVRPQAGAGLPALVAQVMSAYMRVMDGVV